MSWKPFVKLVLKILLYALTLLAGYFGITSMTSCSYQRQITSQGRATIVTTLVDSTTLRHTGNLNIQYR